MSDFFFQLVQARRKLGVIGIPFNYGILFASDYVSTLADWVGPDACGRWLARGRVSYNDLLSKASRTLVYSNPDMVVAIQKRAMIVGGLPKGVELPKNTLMAFSHVLTSSNKDRDGDVLHSDGAEPDPNMLLLWQHVHTQPIGKMICVAEKDSNRLMIVSAIVDMNQLCHDAAVMIDNGMGRFSHGFKALEFTETKEDDGDITGFDITRFEIMEESLVSVPSNVDAETQEVLLSLVEGGKLTSPLMKRLGAGFRERRALSVPGVRIKYRERLGDRDKEITCNSLADLKAAADAGLIGETKDENISRSGSQTGEAGETTASTSEKTDDNDGQTKVPGDAEVACPECDWVGIMPIDGKCPKCGAILRQVEEEEERSVEEVANKAIDSVGEKQGRVISKANETKIRDAVIDLEEASKVVDVPRSYVALVRQAARNLRDVLDSMGSGEEANVESSVKDAIALFLSTGTSEQRRQVKEVLIAFEQTEQQYKLTKQFRDAMSRL